jgi:outer membrane protein OmpA-like peptidoglycan-associated protein
LLIGRDSGKTKSGRNIPLPLVGSTSVDDQKEVNLSGLPVSLVSAVVRYRHWLLATTVVSVMALPQIVSAFDESSDTRRIMLAQQQEDPKKKKEQQKAPPPQQQPKAVQPPPQQQPRQVQPPPPQQQPRQVQPPPQQQPKVIQQQPKTVQPPPPPQQPKTVQPPQQPKVIQQQPKTVQPPPPPQQPKTVQPPPPPQQPKTVQPPAPPQQPNVVQPPPAQQPNIVQPPQQQPKIGQQPQPNVVQPPPQQQPKIVQPPGKFDPSIQKKNGAPIAQPPGAPPSVAQPKTQPKLEVQNFGAPKAPPGPRIEHVNELKGKRVKFKKGNQVIIREPGNRMIIRENNTIIIRHDESARMRRWGNARFETRGQERFTTVRRGNYEIVTVTDANGRLLRRFRRDFHGHEYMLIDNRRRFGIGAAVAGVVLLGIAMPVIAMPRERYIVDVDTAPPMLLYEALEAPSVVPLERAYTLDEIRDNVELRAHVRSVDVNTITFATGSWEVTPDQIPRLQALAEAMLRVIVENPSTVFLIEGHTDAVGAAEDNLSLSDRRAESVAEILTTHFQIPPENLVTQGYGEQHLRVPTQGPSRENRRVVVRNIAPLLNGGQMAPPVGPPG